ncbi:MAG TPA: DNA-formamidopyrimidine glycosylase family protein [Gaiellales bacterium]|nr:DNA-formamidopyrimidine glycosylase family protein [Gaiellales bacterium]
MPEGHSLELLARRLEPIVGCQVTAGPLCGSRVTAVEARGKHLLVHGDRGRSLTVHLGMNGRVRLTEPGRGWGPAVLRTPACDVVITGTRRIAERPTRRVAPALGPDLLHGRFSAVEYLRRARMLERPLCELLLDQRALAGIGNIVRCEVLWEAGQDPFQAVSGTSDRTLLELAVRARRHLRRGVRSGRLDSHVHHRAGRPCPRCRRPIESRMQGEQPRMVYWCPGCQAPTG